MVGKHPSRREAMRTAGAGALFAAMAGGAQAVGGGTAGAETGRAAGRRDVLTRKIPRTGERVPAVGLGTFMTFDKLSSSPWSGCTGPGWTPSRCTASPTSP
jgi:hypothetical protein